MPETAFDAVLIIAFGGPQGPADVRPFLANVVRGRRVSAERLEEVAQTYALFDGKSPLTEITQRQATGLEQRLAARGYNLPVYVGMRNWHPFLRDTFERMSRVGVRRVVGFIAAAHHCYSSCQQYKENILEAREHLRTQGLPDIEVHHVDDWFDHPGYILALADRVRSALAELPSELRSRARLVFTAHSIPEAMARTCRYQQQLELTASLVAELLDCRDWTLAFQSRSGRPEDPWLEPDVSAYLRQESSLAAGLPAVVLVPIGFIIDHMEVIYDLDRLAAATCRELNLPMIRAATVGEHPLFMDVVADLVARRCERAGSLPPLTITA